MGCQVWLGQFGVVQGGLWGGLLGVVHWVQPLWVAPWSVQMRMVSPGWMVWWQAGQVVWCWALMGGL